MNRTCYRQEAHHVGVAAFLLIACVLVLAASPAYSQIVLERSERLASDRPESWAMAYMSAATLFSGFGPAQATDPWSLSIGFDLGHIPHLSDEQRRVGFNGTKLEDLNKSPVFGRARISLELPVDFTMEMSWTPPVGTSGAKPRHLFGLALERPLYQADHWRLGARAFFQHGQVRGDFSCDADTAAHAPGSPDNPFGCRAPSRDRFMLNQHGLELSIGGGHAQSSLAPFASYSFTRMKPRTQVHAEVFNVIDRASLSTRVQTHTLTVGLVYRGVEQWEVAGAMAWTPLKVRRPGDSTRSRDDLTSFRLLVLRGF
jgi:hypothetical protein